MDNTIYIGLPFYDVDTIGKETLETEIDNHFLGEYKHISITTIPHWYRELNKKPLVTCKDANVPYKGTWQGLTEAFPIGKVIKLKECFYEVTTITLEVTGKEVLEETWLTTNSFNAVIHVKPYGVDIEADDAIIINLGVMS
jgi:hypothetical protein